MKTFKILSEKKIRLDELLRQNLPLLLKTEISNSKIRRLIVAGAVSVNQKQVFVPSFTVFAKSSVFVSVDEEKLFYEKQPDDIKFELTEKNVLFEDEYIIVVNKPSHFPTEKSMVETRDNLHAAVVRYLFERQKIQNPNAKNPPYCGQNVLTHSKEVAEIATLIAGEVGANRELAKRAALLHDIGKGAENDSDKNHAEVGAEMARKFGEDQKVINAIAAHHQDCEPATLEAVIVQIADAISAARPGARKETADNYVKRLENLEEIAEKFQGVEKAYAIQAGRELRILVNNEKIPDGDVKELAQKIAKQIETDLRYPGRIKLTMIRETRIVEYAR